MAMRLRMEFGCSAPCSTLVLNGIGLLISLNGS